MKPEDVLDFWFGAPGSAERGKGREVWFRKDPSFDAELRRRFGAVHAQAVAGELAAWEKADESCVALIVVLDQFSRNLFRGAPESFAADPMALRLARGLVETGRDANLMPAMRMFVYLPFEHSEHLADQDEAVRLFDRLAQESEFKTLTEWAEKHRDVIRRFGRFPHRNAILGRASTPDEIAFLQTPGSSF